jgi:hypothetical protein
MSPRAQKVLEQLATFLEQHEASGRRWRFFQSPGLIGEPQRMGGDDGVTLLDPDHMTKNAFVAHSFVLEFQNGKV